MAKHIRYSIYLPVWEMMKKQYSDTLAFNRLKSSLFFAIHIFVVSFFSISSSSLPGTPDPLVFHAPQVFFDCLQQRISAGTRKKRLPNYITGFVRKEALPLGTFTKYTWHITNIMQVKQIFDSQDVSTYLFLTSLTPRLDQAHTTLAYMVQC